MGYKKEKGLKAVNKFTFYLRLPRPNIKASKALFMLFVPEALQLCILQLEHGLLDAIIDNTTTLVQTFNYCTN